MKLGALLIGLAILGLVVMNRLSSGQPQFKRKVTQQEQGVVPTGRFKLISYNTLTINNLWMGLIQDTVTNTCYHVIIFNGGLSTQPVECQ